MGINKEVRVKENKVLKVNDAFSCMIANISDGLNENVGFHDNGEVVVVVGDVEM